MTPQEAAEEYTSKLLPCPLCNGQPGEHVFFAGYITPGNYQAKCTQCRLTVSQDRIDKVIGTWNHRCFMPAQIVLLLKEIAELHSEIKMLKLNAITSDKPSDWHEKAIARQKEEKKDAWDDQREAMFVASVQNRFYHKNGDAYTNFTLDEFKAILIEKSPVSIWCDMYSPDVPLYNITRRIMPSDGGVWAYAHSAGHKNADLITFRDFYRELKVSGLENFRF